MDDLLKVPADCPEVSIKDISKFIDNADDAKFLLDKITDYGASAQVLNLAGNSIGKGGAEAIAPALEKMMDLKYLKFDDMFRTRSKTEIPVTMRILLDAISRSGAQILYLDLADNAVGPVGIEGLKDFLSSPSMFHVYYLNLNNGGWGSSSVEIAKRLIDCHRTSLEAGTPFKLRVFIAGRSRFENIGATSISNAFKMIGTLECISLPQNGIYYSGITALSESLPFNKNLRYLDLSDNTITWRGCRPLAEALKHCNNLENLYLADCLIKSKGIKYLYSTFKNHLPKIKRINLAGNELTAEDALEIIKSTKNKFTLEYLELSTNCFADRFDEVKRAFEATRFDGGVGDEDDDQGSAEVDSSDEGDAVADPNESAETIIVEDARSTQSSVKDSDVKTTQNGTLPPVFASLDQFISYLHSKDNFTYWYDRIAVLVRQLVTIGERHLQPELNSGSALKAREAAYNEAAEYLDAFFDICRLKWGMIEIQLTMVNLLLAHLGFIKCENPVDTFPVKNKFGVYCLIVDMMQYSHYFKRQSLVLRKYLLDEEDRLNLPQTPLKMSIRKELVAVIEDIESSNLANMKICSPTNTFQS